MMKKIIVTGLVLIQLALLSACGWRLRGTLDIANGLETIYVTAQDAHGNLVTDLRRLLEANKITLVNSAQEAQLSINIIRERQERRTVSVGSNALAAEYELTMEAEYSIRTDTTGALDTPKIATVTRSFTFDENDVISKAEEESLIQEEMRRDLAQQIIRRVNVIAKSLSKPATDTPESSDRLPQQG